MFIGNTVHSQSHSSEAREDSWLANIPADLLEAAEKIDLSQCMSNKLSVEDWNPEYEEVRALTDSAAVI